MVLVTGGTGLLGSYILYYLLREGRNVRAIRRSSSSLEQTKFIFGFLAHFHKDNFDPDELLSQVDWRVSSLSDTETLNDCFNGVTEVYHAAALVSFNSTRRRESLETNVEGTKNIVNISLHHNVKKFGYISSVAAINRKRNAIADENSALEGNRFASIYSETKYRAEMEVWRAWGEGLPVVIVNPAIVLGWGDFSKGSIHLFDKVGMGFKFYPPGSNGFADARDVARALIALMKKDNAVGERYIIVGGHLSYKDLFHKIARCLDVSPPGIAVGSTLSYAVWLASGAKTLLFGGEPFLTRSIIDTICNDYRYSSEKLLKTIDFQFTPLDETIAQACEAYKAGRK
ncbi:MAG: SDR family oxidoreductase [Bacteroidota bacterium]|nr:SDR family oxidoreductase [Bacteroidota bacterium]